MLKSYDPWGRPGHGAPKESSRKQKFTEEQLNNPGEQRPADEVGVNDVSDLYNSSLAKYS